MKGFHWAERGKKRICSKTLDEIIFFLFYKIINQNKKCLLFSELFNSNIFFLLYNNIIKQPSRKSKI